YPLVSGIPFASIDHEENIFKSLVEQTLIYGLNFESSSLLEALKSYLVSYYFSSNKKDFRKKLLLSDEKKSRDFFYIYEKVENIGEKRFENFFKTYLQKYLFNGSSEEAFIKKLSQLLEYTSSWDIDDFQRVKIAGTSEITFDAKENRYFLKIKLLQEKFLRPIKVEIKIETEKGEVRKQVFMRNRETWVEVLLSHKVKYIYIDPEYKIFRTLNFDEIPLNWERLFYSKGVIFFPKKDTFPIYRELLENMRGNYHIRYESLSLSALPKDNVIFFEELPLNFHLPFPTDGFYFKIVPHPNSLEHFFAFIKISSLQEIKKALIKIEEVKDAQELFIKKGNLFLFKKDEISVEGIRLNLKDKVIFYGVRSPDFKTIDDILFELLPAQVLFIGEKHDEYAHHIFQLEIIKRFYQYMGHNIAIGLEMVQRPFQKYLDDFIEGKISEEELLEKIEYYDRWKFDYRLYRDIFSFAKEKRIKLIALDLPQELIKKVFKGGLTNLSEEDKKFLPEMDLNQPQYKEFLHTVFVNHNFGNETNFEYFYQAQLLRDEGMAEEIVNYLRKNPDKKILVLVGKGHIQNKYGIPSAIKRRNFFNFKTIVLGEVEEFSPAIADYWFYPPSMNYEKSPALGVILEEVPEGLKIKEVLKGSLAESLNLKPGDLLLMADHRILKKISDLKIVLTFKNKGSELSLKIKREKETYHIKTLIK
ncbi:MAG: ChaN family lipoprotein, partial [Caldimicrobium sp.]